MDLRLLIFQRTLIHSSPLAFAVTALVMSRSIHIGRARIWTALAATKIKGSRALWVGGPWFDDQRDALGLDSLYFGQQDGQDWQVDPAEQHIQLQALVVGWDSEQLLSLDRAGIVQELIKGYVLWEGCGVLGCQKEGQLYIIALVRPTHLNISSYSLPVVSYTHSACSYLEIT